jgi:cytochrome c556
MPKSSKMGTGCLIAASLFLASITANVAAADARNAVEIPTDIRTTMLSNMRDHIGALDDILAAVDESRFDDAMEIAESRLGWSSLVRQGDGEVAKHWAKPMQKMADQMYRSATDFSIAAQNASMKEGPGAAKQVIGALRKVTAACRACHEAFQVK